MGHDRLTFLRQAPEEEQDDDFWYKSGRECDGCGDELSFTDEIFVLEVTEAAQEGGQFFFDLVRGDDDEPAYAPYVMHLECWEEALSVMQEATADTPPVEAENPILTCSCCESQIGNFEPFVASTFGELHVSKRAPNGRPTPTVEQLGHMKPVCLLCIVHVIDDHFDEWEDLVDLMPDLEEDEGVD